MSDTNYNSEIPAFSDRDLQLLVYALRCAEGGFPKIDFKKFAEMGGFKNAHSASVSFTAVRRKVMGEASPKKANPSKRKKAATAAAESDNEDEAPTKKAKTASKKSAKKEQATKPEFDEDEGAAFI